MEKTLLHLFVKSMWWSSRRFFYYHCWKVVLVSRLLFAIRQPSFPFSPRVIHRAPSTANCATLIVHQSNFPNRRVVPLLFSVASSRRHCNEATNAVAVSASSSSSSSPDKNIWAIPSSCCSNTWRIGIITTDMRIKFPGRPWHSIINQFFYLRLHFCYYSSSSS